MEKHLIFGKNKIFVGKQLLFYSSPMQLRILGVSKGSIEVLSKKTTASMSCTIKCYWAMAQCVTNHFQRSPGDSFHLCFFNDVCFCAAHHFHTCIIVQRCPDQSNAFGKKSYHNLNDADGNRATSYEDYVGELLEEIKPHADQPLVASFPDVCVHGNNYFDLSAGFCKPKLPNDPAVVKDLVAEGSKECLMQEKNGALEPPCGHCQKLTYGGPVFEVAETAHKRSGFVANDTGDVEELEAIFDQLNNSACVGMDQLSPRHNFYDPLCEASMQENSKSTCTRQAKFEVEKSLSAAGCLEIPPVDSFGVSSHFSEIVVIQEEIELHSGNSSGFVSPKIGVTPSIHVALKPEEIRESPTFKEQSPMYDVSESEEIGLLPTSEQQSPTEDALNLEDLRQLPTFKQPSPIFVSHESEEVRKSPAFKQQPPINFSFKSEEMQQSPTFEQPSIHVAFESQEIGRAPTFKQQKIELPDFSGDLITMFQADTMADRGCCQEFNEELQILEKDASETTALLNCSFEKIKETYLVD